MTNTAIRTPVQQSHYTNPSCHLSHNVHTAFCNGAEGECNLNLTGSSVLKQAYVL